MAAFGDDGIMDFSLFPYGNAKQTKNADGSYSFHCQHGARECEGNMVIACAQHFHNKTSEWFGFVDCLEQGSPSSDGEDCANMAGFSDWAEIDACTSSSLGNGLMHDLAEATNALIPPHKWTPWVVIDGKPLNEAQLSVSIIELVCDAYTGTKPAVCSKHTIQDKLCLRD